MYTITEATSKSSRAVCTVRRVSWLSQQSKKNQSFCAYYFEFKYITYTLTRACVPINPTDAVLLKQLSV